MAEAIVSVTSILLMGVIFFGPWQSFCTDWARQMLFEQRDRMFDMAADGAISFDSYQYREIRSSIERAIRFSHEATFARMFFADEHLASRTSRLREAARSIEDKDIARRVLKIVNDVEAIQAVSMLWKSAFFPFAIPFALLAFIIFICVAASQTAIMALLQKLGSRVQLEAEYSC